MARTVEKVQEMGNFWDLTKSAVEDAKKMVAQEQARKGIRPNVLMSIDERIEFNNMDAREEDREPTLDEKMNEIAPLLKKAGIKPKDFPFELKRDREGKIIDFEPKGKNKEEVAQNILDFKDKIMEAFDKGKIDQEEFEKINENLEEMMEEKGIELEEDKIEIHPEEIEENIKGLITEMYGNPDEFDKACENYDEMDLEDKKFKLGEFNSKINTKLGIKGDLKFLQSKDVPFEKSFFNKANGQAGYYLTEEEVRKNGLKKTLYNMMEKSMVREKEIKAGIQLSEHRKKVMHDKMIKEAKARREANIKREQEEELRKNQAMAKQYKRDLF